MDEFSRLSALISSTYELGELRRLERLSRGYVNISYRVDAGGKTWLVRRYREGTQVQEIRFEHALIQHLLANGFWRAAPVVGARGGESWVAYDEPEGGQSFYAVFEWLEGDDRYSWVDPRCRPEVIQQAATVLAEYHLAVAGWVPPKGAAGAPQIVDGLSGILATLDRWQAAPGGEDFDQFLLDRFAWLRMAVVKRWQSIAACDHLSMVKLAVHGDFHPGNLKFSGSQVSGLFDFDWSRIDLRVYDVGLALIYFCTSWIAESDQALLIADAALFLNSYQARLRSAGAPGPLTTAEIDFLPQMLSASLMHILKWTIDDNLTQSVDADQYTRFLKMAVKGILWVEDPSNWESLKAILAKVG